MRCCCAALMRTFACLAFSMFAVGCGALAADDAKTEPEPERVPNPPIAKVAPSCTRARTAPLVAVDDVESGSTKVGPCGDVVFRKTDGSLWLRAASGDGALVALTPAGQPGDFDVTGHYLSYARTDSKDAVLRDLESGAETVLPVAASFGFDAEAGAPIVFTCGDGVRVLHADGTLGPVLAAGHVCGDRGLAPYGKKQLLFGEADAVVVDLARETVLHLDVDYVSSPGPAATRSARTRTATTSSRPRRASARSTPGAGASRSRMPSTTPARARTRSSRAAVAPRASTRAPACT